MGDNRVSSLKERQIYHFLKHAVEHFNFVCVCACV